MSQKEKRLADHHFSKKEKKLVTKLEHARVKHAWKTLSWKERPKKFSSAYTHRWNVHEEVLNSATHGVGALLGILALVLMIINADEHQSVYGIVSGCIFGVALILSYISSMIYHMVLYAPVKRIFRILDHSCIFLLIAGTYTPFCLITLHGGLGWTLFGIVWGCALVGITLKFFFVDRAEMLSTVLYLLMGWLAAIAAAPLLYNLPGWAIFWLVAGGLFYTVGVGFFIFERIPFFHTLWHLFVLAGSCSHFFVIFFYVIPIAVR